MKFMRIIVAGGRDFSDYDGMNMVLENYLSNIFSSGEIIDQSKVTFVSGTAKGADTLGENFAKEHGYFVTRFPADWNRYGKRAGFLRNEEMAKYASEDRENIKGILFAFWDGKSKGTKNMINLGHKYGLEVHVFRYN